MSKFGVLVLVGPGARECARVADLFDSLSFYGSEVSCALLVDDEWHSRELSRTLIVPPACEVVSIPNPRQGRGNGWSGGLCVGVLAHRPSGLPSQTRQYATGHTFQKGSRLSELCAAYGAEFGFEAFDLSV